MFSHLSIIYSELAFSKNMHRGYKVWIIVGLLGKIITGAQNPAVKNFLYDVFISNKSLSWIAEELMDERALDGEPALSIGSMKKGVLSPQFMLITGLIFVFRTLMNVFIMKIPIALYFVAFDYCENRYCKIANSQGLYDSLVHIFLLLVMIYCAQCTMRDVIAFREEYFQSLGRE
ncbi:hypothetical protein NEIG_02306 [Nematocida sp. ERTm5]|nr:hypothetical protein NEIG_02306 [Nematocida sp. ERTm5]